MQWFLQLYSGSYDVLVLMFQANVRYNVANDTEAEEESFFLRVNAGRVTGADSNCHQRTMSVCTRWESDTCVCCHHWLQR